MKNSFKTIPLFLVAAIFFASAPVGFAAELEVSGWIPYWRASEGVASARKHLDVLTTVHPFGYSVTTEGKLNDLAKMKKSPWTKLVKDAKKKKVDVIPSIMWSDAASMQKVLSDKKLRENHVEEIGKMVRKGKYAGVDIDYEGKRAETKDHFSAFLRELKNELGSKTLVCTIEARTPPDSLYRTVPATLQYANDYKVIGEVCDIVQLMTYDQERADLKLNDARIGAPYAPVSDIDWVKKVVDLTVQTIPKEKIMLGVPTYGREYEVTVSPNWYQAYTRLWSFNPGYVDEITDAYNVKPSRNAAGEMSVTYLATTSPYLIPANTPVPKNTPSGNIVAAQALALANQTGQTLKFNMLWWSDAEAVRQKAELAKSKGLRGIAIFKVDGGEDPELWDVLKEER